MQTDKTRIVPLEIQPLILGWLIRVHPCSSVVDLLDQR
jgi:hypothetical protein